MYTYFVVYKPVTVTYFYVLVCMYAMFIYSRIKTKTYNYIEVYRNTKVITIKSKSTYDT